MRTHTRRLTALGVAALFAAALGACGKETTGPGPPPPPMPTVTVAPAETSLWVGDTLLVTAVVRDAAGAIDTASVLAWSSSDNDVARVAVPVPAPGAPPPREARIEALDARPATITATAGGASGTLSLDISGLALLVEGYPSGIAEIFRVALPAGAPERILPPGTVAMDPTPSPDGNKIAFVVANYDDTTGDIYIVNRDGTGLRNLTDDEPLDDAPAWSPDGARIAYRSWAAGYLGDIWVRNADGSNPVNLTPKLGPGVVDHHRPAWSPDGAFLAYASTGGGDYGIWTMRADGSEKTQRTSTPDFDTEPTWSRDGAWIAFRRSDPMLGSDIVVMPAAGGSETRLMLAGEQRHPAWSPDGRRIAFTSQADLNAPGEIFSFRPDGTDLRQHTFSSTWAPAYQPGWLRLP
jgi:dipeptidyl aminopeptidase/acylaminoacyl peptidase